MDPGFIVVLLIGAAVGGVLAYRSRIERRDEVARLTAAAAERGWHYTDGDRSLVDRFHGDPFGTGSSRHAQDLFRGEHRGREFLAYEYSYKKGGDSDGGGSKTYTYTVAAVSLPVATSTLQVGPEGLGRKLLGFVGVRDLQLESDEFNEAFHVETDDEKFAYDVLHPRMMQWLINSGRAEYTPFRFERGDLVAWYRHELDPPTVEWMLGYLCDILDQVPAFVWKS